MPGCELCEQAGGSEIYRCEAYRVVLVDDHNYPGFCRVIWNTHLGEMTDLAWPERNVIMDAVWRVEEAVRQVLAPDKINLASLGNVVPHLHWHIIPRYRDDAHFPGPIWAEARRVADPAQLAARRALLPALKEAIARMAGDA